MTKLLDKINDPSDLRSLKIDELSSLSAEIREFITNSVSQTGGHLASNLGVVELSIAMHYVFDFASDRLLWDVGHQCYVHKILTGRKDDFARLRMRDGLSGFPNPLESDQDVFSVGHAGTAIPTALGMALGAQHNKSNEKIVAFVGDASIVNGVSFEALNNLGLCKRQMLIILNDNSMAIDETEGAIASFLSKVRLTHTYDDIRKRTDNILEHLPVIGKKMEGAIHNFTKTVRMALTPSSLFESMDIPYFGPVDGHDIASLVKIFQAMSELNRPAILHAYTKKGKGFTPAGDNPSKYHSTGPFQINGKVESGTETELPPNPTAAKTFTEVFGQAAVGLAEKDDKIIAITAAMADGTGLGDFRDKFPERYYDVGIAESVAVDIAAGLAKQGLKPLVCIYSTFLQRTYDQIFQEVSLQNLPVIFCIDRSGVVGNDGPTHHGLMDIGFIRMLPNMQIIAPADESEMRTALAYAVQCGRPVAIRYPKDKVPSADMIAPDKRPAFEPGKSVTVRESQSDIVIAAVGNIVAEAVKAADILSSQGIDVSVINARFIKPLDEKFASFYCSGKTILTLEDHCQACGFGAAVMESISKRMASGEKIANPGRVISLGSEDVYIKAAERKFQLDQMNITAEKIAEQVKKII